MPTDLALMGGRNLSRLRRVVVVDGTGVSMPDTEANQAEWPQQRTQKPGCGFPTARICACFSLGTGALLSYATGSKHDHELPLFRRQWGIFRKGDIFLADKGVKKGDKARKQLIGRVKRIGMLYQSGLMTDDFYTKTVTELISYLDAETPN